MGVLERYGSVGMFGLAGGGGTVGKFHNSSAPRLHSGLYGSANSQYRSACFTSMVLRA